MSKPTDETKSLMGLQGEEKEDENYAYQQIAIGLVLLVGGIVAGFAVSGWIALGLGVFAAALLGQGIKDLQRERSAIPPPVSKERELLSAIQHHEGRITAAEAAMETSLTVREADQMLSELAGGGHLLVESDSRTLVYTLPARSLPGPKLE